MAQLRIGTTLPYVLIFISLAGLITLLIQTKPYDPKDVVSMQAEEEMDASRIPVIPNGINGSTATKEKSKPLQTDQNGKSLSTSEPSVRGQPNTGANSGKGEEAEDNMLLSANSAMEFAADLTSRMETAMTSEFEAQVLFDELEEYIFAKNDQVPEEIQTLSLMFAKKLAERYPDLNLRYQRTLQQADAQ